jgi:hypothetical protein
VIEIVVQGLKTAQGFSEFAAKLQPGDVLLTSPQPSTATNPFRRALDQTIARASSLLQGSAKTHSLIYTGDGKVVEARIGLGVRRLPLTKAVKNLDTVALRPLAPLEERAEAARRAIALVKKKPGYALKGIVKALAKEHNLPFAIGKVDGVICSDLITNSYDSSLVDKPKDAVLPVDFLRSTRLHQVAEHKGARR